MLRSCGKLRLLCKPTRQLASRHLSEIVKKTFKVQQGGSLLIDFYKADNAVVEISTAWQDHCEVEYDCDSTLWKDFSLEFTEDLKNQKLTIAAAVPASYTEFGSSPIKCLKVVVPEMLNVSVLAHHLDLRVKNKLLGDFIIQSNGGRVEVDKLRGTNLIIVCPESDVIVNKLLEGSSVVQCKSLKAKMINGENVELVAAESIEVGAMYSLQSAITSATKGNVDLGLMQGNTKVMAADGDVSIMGIDGSFEIGVTKGNITLQIGKLTSSSSKQISSAVTVDGTIHTTVDPELVAGVSLESFGNDIQILSDAFEKTDPSSESTDSIEGTLTGQSKGLKRPTFYRGNAVSGKIDKRGAESQSLNSVTGYEEEESTPSLKLVAARSVKLETLSWIEAIRRRHITGGPVMPEIPMGKRAAAFEKLKETAAAAAEVKAQVEAAAAAVVEREEAEAALAVAREEAKRILEVSICTTPVAGSAPATEESEREAVVSLNLDNIPGMQSEGEKYIIMFTCNVCETRSGRKISKKSYHHGVVICRCESCKNLHLISDRMGVFEDESWDIQKHMQTLLERNDINVTHEDNVLEVTIDEDAVEEEGEGEGCVKMEDLEEVLKKK